ncbi:MAG TPA: cupin domain-containing protein, partial [Gaiellales bacterium]|nr:cupin domain-containing protein [Gaiellales bacterium]
EQREPLLDRVEPVLDVSRDEEHVARAATGELYREFLRAHSMSAGLYVLEPGATDPQSPHGQDEAYYVVSGRARFTCAGEDREVATGDVLFVPAHVEHRFHAIEERLSLLVVFAPPEG